MYNVHYHIFVRKSYLFAYVINEEVPDPYQCPREKSWCICKYDRRGSIQQIDAAEMKNVNTKRKTKSDIMIFKDGLSTVGEPCNPKDIGVEEMNMHLTRFVFRAHEIQTGLRTDSVKCIQASIGWYLIDGEFCYSHHCVDYWELWK
jgi:hypothetical protein